MTHCALDMFMNQLIQNSDGCTATMTIISDNAKVMTKKKLRRNRRSAPERSRSLPLNRHRWTGATGSSVMEKPGPRLLSPMSTIADVECHLSLSRWESLVGPVREDETCQTADKSLTLPKRVRTPKSKSRGLKKLTLVQSKSSDRKGACSKGLPKSLRTLPY